ncbi:hypothetical protein DL98DRAFT_226057 [Cadophora sp. DSE1049]|nr:hypothetical protein DL98DRAFT_226057 [Cadophora sp. DSE1049]
MPPFRYEPLLGHDSIRLLLLSPSRDDSAEIQCNLTQSTLRDCKEDLIDQYTALSYVWGIPMRLSPFLLMEAISRSLGTSSMHCETYETRSGSGDYG